MTLGVSLGYLAANGALLPFWDAVFTYGADYAHPTPGAVMATMLNGVNITSASGFFAWPPRAG